MGTVKENAILVHPELVERLETRRHEMLADLALLVAVESPSGDVAALTRSAETIADMMRRLLGTPADIVSGPAGPHVHWRGGGEPRVLVLGHHDTVFPAGTAGERPFAVADGRATGPGVFDMKAGIVQALYGLSELGDLSYVEVLFTSDEEVGSATSRSLLEQRARVCGHVLVLEPSGDGGALKTARKGTGRFVLHAHGRAAHAGLEPEKGVNALVEAALQIPRICALARPELGTTVTPTLAVAGTAENVVPAAASITVDVRVEHPDEKGRLESSMRGLEPILEGATLDVEGGLNRPPMHSSASEALFPVAQEAAERLGLGAVEGIAVGGGSDGNFTAALGIPTLDGLGAVGGGAHADHEYVEVATMPVRAALVAGVVALV